MAVRRFLRSRWLQGGIDLLFPPHCVACARPGGWFCEECLAAVVFIQGPLCPRCGKPMSEGALCYRCRTSALQLEGIRSVAVHEGTLRKAIHALKYEGRRELAAPLGQMLTRFWRAAELPGDLVVPVPLHPSRQIERGFNQAELLAEVLVAGTGQRLNGVDLARTRATPPQVGLAAAQRRENVQGAFRWRGRDLAGVSVLLVDDVCTTGATLEASAVALRRGGAGTVWALTLARPIDLVA